MQSNEFYDVKAASKRLKVLRGGADARFAFVTRMGEARVTNKERVAKHYSTGKGGPVFHAHVLLRALANDICSSSEGSIPINFSGVIDMADQIVEASKILGETEALFEKNLKKFGETADKTIREAKNRVSQINDYSNRLASALSNLNKVLGDDAMVKALENAERISSALKVLESLQQSGSLEKIFSAMQPK